MSHYVKNGSRHVAFHLNCYGCFIKASWERNRQAQVITGLNPAPDFFYSSGSENKKRWGVGGYT